MESYKKMKLPKKPHLNSLKIAAWQQKAWELKD